MRSPVPVTQLFFARLQAAFITLGILLSWVCASASNDSIPSLPHLILHEESFLSRMENLAEESENEYDYSGLLEELALMINNPINLNTATDSDLRRLLVLSDIQINNLLNHISRFGKLISIYELQSIDGFDQETIRLILPFVRVSGDDGRRHFSLYNMRRDGQSQFLLRVQQLMEQQSGYSYADPQELADNPNSRYSGSPLRIYSRYRFTYYQNVSLGLTAEKDPGEEFFKGSQPNGFDFYSGHLFLRDFGKLQALAVGDYQVQFGQGLTLWSGISFGKSSSTLNVKNNGGGLRPYTSSDENNFMRGIGSTVGFGNFKLTAFWSSKNHDANVLELDTNNGKALSITSLQQTGLHRTPRELGNKHSVKQSIYGGNLSFNLRSFSAGFTAYRMELGADFRRNLTFYNQFDFNERSGSAFGVDFNYILRNINFFGESAISQNGGYAVLNGAIISLDPRVSISLAHRIYSRDYQSLYSAAFGENTRVANENGLFVGIELRPWHAWRLSAYADHFSFQWMKYRTYSPSSGFDYLAQINFNPSRELEVYARYRARNKPLNSPEAFPIPLPNDAIRKNFRLHMSYGISPSITIRNRLEMVDYKAGKQHEKGFLIYYDILYRNLGSPLSITIRYALFGTDGFDSRIYAYENDVLYAYSFPFYYDKGSRAYILVRYRITRSIDINARLSQTFYTNRDSSGSGLDEIQGNTRTELKAQLRVRF